MKDFTTEDLIELLKKHPRKKIGIASINFSKDYPYDDNVVACEFSHSKTHFLLPGTAQEYL